VAETGRRAVSAHSQCPSAGVSRRGGQSTVAIHHVPDHRPSAPRASQSHTQLNDDPPTASCSQSTLTVSLHYSLPTPLAASPPLPLPPDPAPRINSDED